MRIKKRRVVATIELPEHLKFLILAISWHQTRDRCAHHFAGRKSENLFRPFIPTGDDASRRPLGSRTDQLNGEFRTRVTAKDGVAAQSQSRGRRGEVHPALA